MNKLFNIAFVSVAMTLAAATASAQENTGDQPVKAIARQKATTDLDSKYAVTLLKPGTDAPGITLKTADGKTFSLSSMRGKYVVLDFWASWCPDCRKDAPNIIAMYDRFHEKGVEFVGVSFDKDATAWKNCVEKLGIKYTQASDLKGMRESDVAKAYGIKWIPSVYIIDPQGKVALATVMSDKLDAYLTSVYPDCDE